MASLEPYTGTLGLKKAAHLLRRASFGGNKQQIDHFANMNITEALDLLFADFDKPAPPIDPKTGETWLNPKAVQGINSEGFELIRYYKAWHLEQMRKSGTNAGERMVYFYHTHLPVQFSIVRDSAAVYYQNALYRHYAFGNFKTMFTKLTADNAMLRYIDNHLNQAGSPNENYAREMMELYSIGKGEQIAPGDYSNYTEDDIKEAARVISGFKTDIDYTNLDPDTGIPRGILRTNDAGQAYLHDPGVKNFSEKFQNQSIQPNELEGNYATEDAVWQEINDMMDMIFAQNATAEFLCRKIYRQFVYYKINEEIETDIIQPLAQTFRDNDYDIVPVVRQLLASKHFFDADNAETPDNHIGAIIKSPVELVLGTVRFFDINFELSEPEIYRQIYVGGLLRMIDEQGMSFYEPIDVAGYPAYHQTPTYNRYWITPSNLAYRYEFGQILIDAFHNDMPYGLDIVSFVDNNISNPADSDIIVQELTDYMLPAELEQNRLDYFKSILTDKYAKNHWEEEWLNYKSGKSDIKVVQAQLEALITAILQSPEYQLG